MCQDIRTGVGRFGQIGQYPTLWPLPSHHLTAFGWNPCSLLRFGFPEVEKSSPASGPFTVEHVDNGLLALSSSELSKPSTVLIAQRHPTDCWMGHRDGPVRPGHRLSPMIGIPPPAHVLRVSHSAVTHPVVVRD
jgi:hypothetical protein